MQGLMRLVCLGYLVFLTALLLTSNPMVLVGVRGDAPGILRALIPAAHLLSFLVLAVLALMARWPVPRWGIVVFLMFYAGMTEVAQSLLPPRTAEWMDWLQDLAGIGVGAGVCWFVAMAANMLTRSQRMLNEGDSMRPSEDWEVARRVLSRSGDRGPSSWNRGPSWWN